MFSVRRCPARRWMLYTLCAVATFCLYVTNYYTRHVLDKSSQLSAGNFWKSKAFKNFSYSKPPQCQSRVKHRATLRTYTILVWTSYYYKQKTKYLHDPMVKSQCVYVNCHFMSDRSLLETSDSVVFHQFDMRLGDMPTYRNPQQTWVMFNLEPPQNTFQLSRAYDDTFNWSMTYNSHDDVTVPYFTMCRMSGAVRKGVGVHAESKLFAAVWLASNCNSSSHRLEYVRELQKYFQVDVVGACSKQLRCPMSHKKCLDAFLPKYRFALAFENSICTDYVTEKLQNVLHYDVIPIVWGGANYGELLPHGSYVEATDYALPEDLAKALEPYRDNEAFVAAVEARRGIRAKTVDWKCRLCEKLNTVGDMQRNSRKHLLHDFLKMNSCRTWINGSFSLLERPP